MSSKALNAVYKSGVLAIEECPVTVDIVADSTVVNVSGRYMDYAGPFTAGGVHTIYDSSSWDSSGNPNAERFKITSLGVTTSTAAADGIGYDYTSILHVACDNTSGWLHGFHNNYTTAFGAKVLTPGCEVALQSSDFNNRFKTLSDAPKVDFDDEASRFATGDEGRDLSIAGARSAEITFTKKLSWAGDATTVPAWDKVMRTMGHMARATATGIEYLPHTYANEVTATIWVQCPENEAAPVATVFRYIGAHGGNGSGLAVGKVGDPYMLTAKYNAAYVGTMELSQAQTRALTSPDTSVPEVMLSNSVTLPARVGGATVTKSVEISQFNLDFGGVVNPLIDQATTTGYAYYGTQDREPKLTVNPYMSRKIDDDVDYVVSNSVTGTVTIKSALTSPHITIEVPNAQLLSPTYGSREGYINTDRNYRALRNNLGSGAVEAAMPDQCMYSVRICER